MHLLQDHALGKIKLDSDRRQSAQFLLSYVLPKPPEQQIVSGEYKFSWQS